MRSRGKVVPLLRDDEHRKRLVAAGMMSVAEAAQFAGVSTWTIRAWARRRAIVFARLGSRTCVPRQSLLDYLAAKVDLT